jgi:RNA polymerase sigma-70 factor (ECF subfamily)
MTMTTTTGATTATSRARALSLSGRRRERAAGEQIALLFEEHGRLVYGVCRLMLRDPVEAEDAAQQTFLSAYRALLGGQEPREPSAWLGTIARNECRTRFRARRTEPLTLVREPVGEELQREVDRREEIQSLCAALAELPPQQRDAVVLREFYGLSYAEVGAALGLSGSAVESVIFRSRRRLQDQLRPARSALGLLTLPVSLRDSLAQALPGFAGSGASTGAGAAVFTKFASAPIAAKVAAAALAVGAAGTAAGLEKTHVARHHGRVVLRPAAAQVAPARVPAVPRPPTSAPSAPASRVALVVHRTTVPPVAHESGSGKQAPEQRSGEDGSTTSGSSHESGGGSGSSGGSSGDTSSGSSSGSGDSGRSGSGDSGGSGEPGD